MTQPKDLFDTQLPKRIEENGARYSDVDAIFYIKINGEGGGDWTVNLKDTPGVTDGDAGNSDCTLECEVDDWVAIQKDPQAAMQMFFEGKLKIGGNAMLAQNLGTILA
jgi:putative sterol carrier protein